MRAGGPASAPARARGGPRREVDPGDALDAVEPLAQRVGVDEERLRGGRRRCRVGEVALERAGQLRAPRRGRTAMSRVDGRCWAPSRISPAGRRRDSGRRPGPRARATPPAGRSACGDPRGVARLGAARGRPRAARAAGCCARPPRPRRRRGAPARASEVGGPPAPPAAAPARGRARRRRVRPGTIRRSPPRRARPARATASAAPCPRATATRTWSRVEVAAGGAGAAPRPPDVARGQRLEEVADDVLLGQALDQLGLLERDRELVARRRAAAARPRRRSRARRRRRARRGARRRRSAGRSGPCPSRAGSACSASMSLAVPSRSAGSVTGGSAAASSRRSSPLSRRYRRTAPAAEQPAHAASWRARRAPRARRPRRCSRLSTDSDVSAATWRRVSSYRRAFSIAPATSDATCTRRSSTSWPNSRGAACAVRRRR